MDDTAVVGGLRGPGQRFDQLGCLARRLRPARDEPPEMRAIHILQHDVRQPVVLADVINLHHVRMVQPSDRFGFGAETGSAFRKLPGPGDDHLDRDQAFEVEITRLEDDAHAAAAQFFQIS